MNPGEDKEFSWSTQTHEHREHSTDWYWTFIVGALALAGFAVFLGNILFAIIVVMGIGSILFLAARGPREHVIRIDERGVSVDGTRYPFNAIHSFWIERGVETPRLFITMNGVLSPHLSIPLSNKEEALKVQQLLSRVLTEEEQGPHFGENLARLIGL